MILRSSTQLRTKVTTRDEQRATKKSFFFFLNFKILNEKQIAIIFEFSQTSETIFTPCYADDDQTSTDWRWS